MQTNKSNYWLSSIPWASKAGGGGREDAPPAVKKSAGDVPPEIIMFQ